MGEMNDLLVPSGLSAAVVAVILQGLKNNPDFRLMSRETPWVNRTISVVAAGITALGISATYSFDAQTGAFTLGFAGTVGGLLHGLSHWVGQWSGQHLVYKFLALVEAVGEQRAILKEALLGQLPQEKKNVPQQPAQ